LVEGPKNHQKKRKKRKKLGVCRAHRRKNPKVQCFGERKGKFCKKKKGEPTMFKTVFGWGQKGKRNEWGWAPPRAPGTTREVQGKKTKPEKNFFLVAKGAKKNGKKGKSQTRERGE